MRILRILAISCALFSWGTVQAADNQPTENSKKAEQRDYCLITGNSNPELAGAIAKELGVQLIPANVGHFNDGETSVSFDGNVRNKTVFMIHPTCRPVKGTINDSVMELMAISDALNRASAKKIIAVIPYFGYARQDRKGKPHVPISASMVARMIENSSDIQSVVTVDLHCGQIQGFFQKTPVDNIYGSLVLAPEIAKLNLGKVTVVSPDAGGVDRAVKFRDKLASLGVDVEDQIPTILKKRLAPGVVDEKASIVTGDIEGRNLVVVDDILDTAGTLTFAAKLLMEGGAASVYACVTHGVLSGPAMQRIAESVFTKVFITDTIPLREAAPPQLVQVPMAHLLAQVIKRIENGDSVSALFS